MFPTVVTSMTVPAGDYVVWATGQVDQTIGTDGYLECTLDAGGTVASQAIQVNSYNYASYSLVGTGVLSSPGTIELDCVGSTNQSFGPLVDNNHLVAVPVDALN